MRADEDRNLALFEADRAVACGIHLSPRPTLYSFAKDIETQINVCTLLPGHHGLRGGNICPSLRAYSPVGAV